MREQKNSIRLYVICWGISSIAVGSCMIAIPFLEDKAVELAGFLLCVCLALMLWLFRAAIREDDNAEKTAYRLPFSVQKIAIQRRKKRFMKGMKLKGGA
jgi:hypothetical protein